MRRTGGDAVLEGTGPDSGRPAGLLRRLLWQVRRVGHVGGIVGWRRLAWIAPLWLCVRRYQVLVRDAAAGPPAEAGSQEELQCERISNRDLDLLVALNPHWSRRQLEVRLREGQEGLLWRRRGEPVHVRWLSRGRTRLSYLGLDFEPREGDLLSFEAFTRPDERGRGLWSVSFDWTLRWMERSGGRRLVAFVAWWNRPVRKLLERRGARCVGAVDAVGFGPFLSWRSSGRARLRGRSTLRID